MSSSQPIAILPEYIANSPTRVYLGQRLIFSSGHPLDVSYSNASTASGRPTQIFTTYKARGMRTSTHDRVTLYSTATGATVYCVENSGSRWSRRDARWHVCLPGQSNALPAVHTEKRRGLIGRGGLWVWVANAAISAAGPWRPCPEVWLEVKEGRMLGQTEVFVASSGVRVMSARKSVWHFRRGWYVDVAAGMDISLVSYAAPPRFLPSHRLTCFPSQAVAIMIILRGVAETKHGNAVVVGTYCG